MNENGSTLGVDILRSKERTRLTTGFSLSIYFCLTLKGAKDTMPTRNDFDITTILNQNTYSELLNQLNGSCRKSMIETPSLIIETNGLPLFMLPTIKDVIFNPPATIIFWSDNTKTVVKADGEPYDPEKGIAMAISKKMLGDNKYEYYNIFKHWLKMWNKQNKNNQKEYPDG